MSIQQSARSVNNLDHNTENLKEELDLIHKVWEEARIETTTK